MKAVDYLKERSRMCAFHQYCIDCPISNLISNTSLSCKKYEEIHPEEVVAIVENWAKEHPVKTYVSVLLDKLPNIKINNHGVPFGCPSTYFKAPLNRNCLTTDCLDCWNREYKEEE
jgi:hypothetical protein